MKKIIITFLGIFVFLPAMTIAYGECTPSDSITFKLTNNSAVADGKQKITVQVTPCRKSPSDGKLYADTYNGRSLSLSGDGVTISSSSYVGPDLSQGLGALEDNACGDVKVSWDVTSTASGIKKLSVSSATCTVSEYNKNTTVAFTAPTTTPTTTTTTTTTTNNENGEEETKEKPETPVLKQKEEGNEFKYNEGAKFSGTTIPNGIVHLYFNSDPYEATTTADKDGNWEYTLDKDLGEGEHKLEIAVEDPETDELSDKTEAYSFILVAGETTETENTQEVTTGEDTSYPTYFWFLIGGIVVVLVGSGVGGWYYLKKKQPKKKEPEPRLKNQ